ncbi:MAG: hypothetical protein ABJA57_08180 [Ginsengibacter sp.]
MNHEPAKDDPGNVDKAVPSYHSDLPDNKHDRKEMESETFTIDLPDVKDIPGQEFIHPLPPGEFSDTTISSDDEEGIGIFEEGDDEILIDDQSDISSLEKRILEHADEDMPTGDEANLRNAELDDSDEEGSQLNEESGAATRGLDVPGSEDDDQDEDMGDEDEENNEYSLGADKD